MTEKGKEKVPGTASITAALKKVKVRYPGEQELVSLGHLISQNRLVELFSKQYPDVFKQPGCVQFIPELRGYVMRDRNPAHKFLKSKVHQQTVLNKHETHISGMEHEFDVQDAFASLRGSELINDRSLLIMHSIGKTLIWHSKLKTGWNREFDLVVFDPHYGVFLCEIKQRSYQRLKENTHAHSLEKELEKQKKRYCLFSELRQFYGKYIPIHTILLCNSRQDESRIIEEETAKINEKEYNFVVDLNLKDFTVLWSNVLGCMKRVAVPIADNIMGFTSLLYVIQSIDTLRPSDIHSKLVRSEFQLQEHDTSSKGKRRLRQQEMSILWTREQEAIIDYFISSFIDQTAAASLRMCITGCYGSGKTLLLIKFVDLYAEKFPDYQILFLVGDGIATNSALLLQRLSYFTFPQHLKNIKFARTLDYMDLNFTTEIQTFRKFLSTQYQLVLIDEYVLQPGWKLDLLHISDCHLVCATSYRNTAEDLTGFQLYNLSGSLRSVKEITEYVRNQQAYETTNIGCISKPVVVQPLHNVAYQPVKTTHVVTGQECIERCIATLTDILANDRNSSIMIISSMHRYFLYRLSMQLHEGNIEHYFRDHSIGAPTSTEQDCSNCTVILCDYEEIQGCECSSVIYVRDEGSVPAEFAASIYAAAAADSVSRSTTQAVVFVITGTYNEDVIVPLPAAGNIAVPCYQHVGRMSSKEFVHYLAGLIPSCNVLGQNKPFPEAMANKKILVVHSHQVSSIINDNKNITC